MEGRVLITSRFAFFSEGKAYSPRKASVVCSVYCLHRKRKQKVRGKCLDHCEQSMFIFLNNLYIAWNHIEYEKSNLRLMFLVSIV